MINFKLIPSDDFHICFLCQNPQSFKTFAKIKYNNLLNEYVLFSEVAQLSQSQVEFILHQMKILNK